MAAADMIQTMDDAALVNLRNNAMRISTNAGSRQKEAERLLPLIDAEIAERKAKKPVPARRPSRKKVVVAVEA